MEGSVPEWGRGDAMLGYEKSPKNKKQSETNEPSSSKPPLLGIYRLGLLRI